MKYLSFFVYLGIILIIVGVFIAVAYGGGNSTSNMTLDCVRMFYSDSWDKGYVVDLSEYCRGNR